MRGIATTHLNSQHCLPNILHYYTTGREIIAKKVLKTHRLSGKAYKDLDSTIVIVIFYGLND